MAAVARRRGSQTWLIITAFLSGFSVMVVEMAAVRAMAPYFGASTYTWTNVIGVILAALSAGYFVGGRWIDRHPRDPVLYGTLLFGALLVIVVAVLVAPVSRGLLPAADAVEGAIQLVYRASLVATLLLFAPPVFLLGMISPMAIRLLATPDHVGSASGRIFAASTLGSILGTFATTFWLIPSLGSRETITLAGAVLVVAGVVGLVLSAVPRKTMAGGGGAVVAAIGGIVAVLSAGPMKAAEGQVEEMETAYQYVRVLDSVDNDGTPVRLLQINEAEQAYQSVQLAGRELTNGRYYDYYSVLPLLLGSPDRAKLDVLLIGLAAGTIPKQLHHFYPEGLHVTGVEIDADVVEVGRRRFDLPADADWLDVRIADGRVFLRTTPPGPRYDLIIVDAFAEELYIPFHLATEQAFREAKDRLAPGGILAMNAAAYRPDSELLRALEATVAEVFGRAWRVSIRNYPNWMIFAMKDAEPDMGRWWGTSGRSVGEWDTLRDLARRAASGAVVVKAGESEGLVLTDDLAPVERLIDHSMARESRAIMGE